MHWAALRTDPLSAPSTDATVDVAADPAGIAVWALQFTPRVAFLETAVLLEVEHSLRLFGGEDHLHALVEAGAAELGVTAWAWAPTSLAALAMARAGVVDGFAKPLPLMLDRLPFDVVSGVGKHGPTLARLGCRTLADVRRLPRGGLSRRFDKELLMALDQAYGLRPETYPWVALPEVFNVRLELPGRVDTAAGLMFGARRLLLQLGGWLAARHAGVTAITLHWCHDTMRARDAGDGGELTIRTAEPTQNVDHLSRLLSEHLAKVELKAPAGELRIVADDVTAIVEATRSLLPDTVRAGEAVPLVLERIQARLGKKRVLRPVLAEDHRSEWMQHWKAADTKPSNRPAPCAELPQPSWILRHPLKLAMVHNRPVYQGPLQMLLGPQRVEGGWWHRVVVKDGDGDTVQEHSLNAQRDYWIAQSQHAGVLWIFQERLAVDQVAWYLHGHFA